MNEGDISKIKIVMGEVLEEVVLPQLQEIREDVAVLKEDVSVLKEDVAVLKEDFQHMDTRMDRMERKQDAEIERYDRLSVNSEDHSKRLLKLEAAK